MSFEANELIFLPLGGSGEIGMNANLYHYKDRWLMVDLGISFPDETMPGVDVVLPDISYIEARKDKLEGLILTHAHEDHFGAIPYLWGRLGVPIYGTAFTLALLRRKLAENRVPFKVPMHEIAYNIDYKFGPFSVELVAVNHSIPDPAALAVRTDKGTVIHTGDWKFDETPLMGTDTDKERLRAIGDEGVLAMVGDSTNAMVPGRTPSESTAKDGLTKAISEAKRAVAVTCFASNVARIRSIINAAQANRRSVCVVGRALNRTIDAAQEVGYLKDVPDFVSEADIGLMPRENLVIICTGSQGEPRAAMSRIAANAHDTVALERGDTVIFSSRQIPGNEPAIAKVQDMLIRRGMRLITDEDAPVHVSGHPAREELIKLYGLVRPKIAIPVHGTARHLQAHAELAENCQVSQTIIPDNGTMINLSSETVDIVGHAPVGLLTHEGGEIINIQDNLLRTRRRMLWNGTVTATVVLDGGGGLVLAPSVRQSGLCQDDKEADYLADCANRIEDVLDDLSTKKRRDDSEVEEAVQRAARYVAKQMVRLRPTVHVHIMRANATELL